MARSLRRTEPVEIAVGMDGTITIPLFDSVAEPLDVSNMTAEWKLFRAVPRRARKPFTGFAVLTKTSAAGEIALTTGNAVVSIADSDLAMLSGAFWQALALTDASGAIARYGQGLVNVRAAA